MRYNTKYEYGKIKNPRLARVRTDIRWTDIVENMDALGPVIPFNPDQEAAEQSQSDSANTDTADKENAASQ